MSKAQLTQICERLRARREKLPKSVEESRREFETESSKLPVAKDIQRESLQADGVPVDWVTVPASQKNRVALYFHGGGYVIGSTTTHLGLIGSIARACEARCLSVEYRLAPEHPHPAAVEDACTAYRWLLAQGFAPEQIIVMGDSAGGGLTMALLVSLRDAGTPLPAAAALLSPWVDLEAIGDSADSRAEEDPIIMKRGVQIFGKLYAGKDNLRAPLAAPLYADLRGLPPVLIQVGTAEVLYDDSTRLAARLKSSGVSTTLSIYEHMIHVWQVYSGMVDEADEAIAELAQFAKTHWPAAT